MLEPIRDALWDIGIEVVLAVIAAMGAYALALTRRAIAALEDRTGVQIDEAHRRALEDALTNAIAEVEARVGAARPEDVAGYLREFNPDALRRFGLDDGRLIERIRAAIAARRQPVTIDLPEDLS